MYDPYTNEGDRRVSEEACKLLVAGAVIVTLQSGACLAQATSLNYAPEAVGPAGAMNQQSGTITSGTAFETGGYRSVGDGGAGFYHFVSGNGGICLSADGGSIIANQPLSTPGCWVLDSPQPWSLLQFGGTSTTATGSNNAAALAALIAAVGVASRGGEALIPAGTFPISGPGVVISQNNITLVGAGVGSSRDDSASKLLCRLSGQGDGVAGLTFATSGTTASGGTELIFATSALTGVQSGMRVFGAGVPGVGVPLYTYVTSATGSTAFMADGATSSISTGAEITFGAPACLTVTGSGFRMQDMLLYSDEHFTSGTPLPGNSYLLSLDGATDARLERVTLADGQGGIYLHNVDDVTLKEVRTDSMGCATFGSSLAVVALDGTNQQEPVRDISFYRSAINAHLGSGTLPQYCEAFVADGYVQSVQLSDSISQFEGFHGVHLTNTNSAVTSSYWPQGFTCFGRGSDVTTSGANVLLEYGANFRAQGCQYNSGREWPAMLVGPNFSNVSIASTQLTGAGREGLRMEGIGLQLSADEFLDNGSYDSAAHVLPILSYAPVSGSDVTSVSWQLACYNTTSSPCYPVSAWTPLPADVVAITGATQTGLNGTWITSLTSVTGEVFSPDQVVAHGGTIYPAMTTSITLEACNASGSAIAPIGTYGTVISPTILNSAVVSFTVVSQGIYDPGSAAATPAYFVDSGQGCGLPTSGVLFSVPKMDVVAGSFIVPTLVSAGGSGTIELASPELYVTSGGSEVSLTASYFGLTPEGGGTNLATYALQLGPTASAVAATGNDFGPSSNYQSGQYLVAPSADDVQVKMNAEAADFLPPVQSVSSSAGATIAAAFLVGGGTGDLALITRAGSVSSAFHDHLDKGGNITIALSHPGIGAQFAFTVANTTSFTETIYVPSDLSITLNAYTGTTVSTHVDVAPGASVTYHCYEAKTSGTGMIQCF